MICQNLNPFCARVMCAHSDKFSCSPPPPRRMLALFWYFVALIVATETIPAMMNVSVGLFVASTVTFISHAVYFMVPLLLIYKRGHKHKGGLGREGGEKSVR